MGVMNMEGEMMNLKDTELRLGLPGRHEEEAQPPCSVRSNKRSFQELSTDDQDSSVTHNNTSHQNKAPPAKVQVVGWPPVRSYRKNCVQQQQKNKGCEVEGGNNSNNNMYVKVSMDGAAYLRKVDLRVYNSYAQLLKALQEMFKCSFGEYCEREGYNGSEFAPTYQDKDGDWMLVGDVPWNMFMSSCKRMRIMKGSEAKGLGASS